MVREDEMYVKPPEEHTGTQAPIRDGHQPPNHAPPPSSCRPGAGGPRIARTTGAVGSSLRDSPRQNLKQKRDSEWVCASLGALNNGNGNQNKI